MMNIDAPALLSSTKIEAKKRKRSVGKKRATEDKLAGPTTKKKRNEKGKVTLFDRLCPTRKREVNHIARRAAQNEVITPAFITAALRLSKQSERKIAMLPEYRIRIQNQLAMALQKCVDDPDKTSRLNTQYGNKCERISRIENVFNNGAKLSLKAGDEVFLGRIRLTKPLSGYMLYAKDNRTHVQETNVEAGFGQIGRLIGAQWRALSDDDRENWKQKALRQHIMAGGAITKPKKNQKKPIVAPPIDAPIVDIEAPASIEAPALEAPIVAPPASIEAPLPATMAPNAGVNQADLLPSQRSTPPVDGFLETSI